MTDQPTTRPNENLDAKADVVLIAANRFSGSSNRRALIVELQEVLVGLGYQVELLDDIQQWTLRSEYWRGNGRLLAMVSAGGDGTLSAVCNAIDASIPILVFPLGTENLVSKYLGLNNQIDDAVEALRRGCRKKFDVGVANGKLFLVMLSVGFDAAVVKQMHETRKGHIYRWSWFAPILHTIWNYEYPILRVERYLSESCALESTKSPGADVTKRRRRRRYHYPALQAGSETYQSSWLFAFNLPQYAAGLPIGEEAVGDDGLLDVCSFERGSFLSGVRYLFRVLTRTHPSMNDCRIDRCETLRVESEAPVPYQVDGDWGGMLPVEIQLLRQRVTLVLPAENH